ncbi:UDP-N-acetylmuramate dehydrogenase [Desulfovulcanus sp.]
MRIINRPELKRFSTLKLGGRGRRLYLAYSYSELDELGCIWPEIKDSAFVLGRGSNVLFCDGDVDLVLIKWVGGEAPQILDESENEVLVEVSASLSLPRFLGWCIEKGFSGLEGLAGIPGTVGGAVAMNAGSHGVEIGSKIEKVKVWSPEQGVFWLDREDMHITYRDFKPKTQDSKLKTYLILGAILRLGKDDSGVIKKRIVTWYERKKKTQPVLQATAGCVFKNPILGPQENSFLGKTAGTELPNSSTSQLSSVSAGWLLDQAGFRGKKLGGVGFSALHANFLVNYGQGTSTQALELIELARDKVSKMWGIILEMEVKVVPCL